MAVRLHRASPLRNVERLHLATSEPARAEDEIPTPRLGTPSPAFPPPPTVRLRPPAPIRIESPMRRTGRRVAVAAAVVVAAAWLGTRLGSSGSREVTMAASVVDAPRTILADADGSLSSVAAVGAILEPGSAIAEISVTDAPVAARAATPARLEPGVDADPVAASRIERELDQTSRELPAARRAQVEIEALYRSERATRTEREEAGAFVRTLTDRRARLTAELAIARGTVAAADTATAPDAVAAADAVAAPRTLLRSDRHAIVREVLRANGAGVKRGDPIAVVVSRTARAAAPLAADSASPASAGDLAHVTAGTRAYDATVVGVEIGPHGRQLVVEFDPGADRPLDGDPVEIRLAAGR